MIQKIFIFLAAFFFVATTANLNQFSLSSKGHPLLGAASVDRFCSVSNTINSTCTIANKTVLLTADYNYTTNLTLIFSNTSVQCDKSFPFCSLYIKLSGKNGITLKNGSTFIAK